MNRFFDYIKQLFAAYFTFGPYLVTQAEAEDSIRDGVSFRGTNMVILIMAIFIASLGLNTNSTAVIIGAMLISPLMGPIIGVGLGIGIHDFELLKRSLRNLVMAAGFSVATSTIYFLISPVGGGHSELLARTSPTIYDVLIGFFGGGAGIVAICSKSKGNVIPGVAIATALMPPLCTVGYGLATWQMQYFFGALYLFLINSIFIGLATYIGIKVMKFQPTPTTDPVRAKRVMRAVYLVAILTLLPSIYLTYNMIRQSRFDINCERFVKNEFNFTDTHVLSTQPQWTRSSSSLTVTLIGRPIPQDSLLLALSSRMKYYGLERTRLDIVQGAGFDEVGQNDNFQTNLRDIYQLTQASLSQKQATIDSLQSIISAAARTDTVAASLIPELRVIFPQVSDIAVSRTIVASTDSTRLDTINIALIKFNQHLSGPRTKELSEYLAARLRLHDIKIVTL